MDPPTKKLQGAEIHIDDCHVHDNDEGASFDSDPNSDAFDMPRTTASCPSSVASVGPPHAYRHKAAKAARQFERVILAGAGFLADAYALFVINMVLAVMAEIYPQTSTDKSAVASTVLWGAVLGQLFFGTFADYMGRRVCFFSTCLFITIGALGSCTCVQTQHVSVYTQLAIWRFILGVGVGGEYPLAATIACESSTPKTRGRAMAAVFSMQGVGALLATAVMLVCVKAGASYEFTWRFGLAFGALPSLSCVYLRWTMEETHDFQEAKAARSSHTRNLLAAPRVFWKPLLGTAGTWFLLDVTFFGNGLFTAHITEVMGLGNTLEAKALNAFILALIALPGYFLTVAFLDPIGRKNLQTGGFSILLVLFAILGFEFDALQSMPALFITLYGFTFLFSNFGPNATTYIIPGEYYPAEVKATLHGVCAACGKLGAALATYTFPPLEDAIGIPKILIVCAGVHLMGLVLTVWAVPRYSADDLDRIKCEQMEIFRREAESNAVPDGEKGESGNSPSCLRKEHQTVEQNVVAETPETQSVTV